MVRISITPIIRGAYMDVLGFPVILASEEAENPRLPKLNLSGPGALWHGHGSAPAGAFAAGKGETAVYSAEVRAAEAEIGRQARAALASLRNQDGSIPAAVQVPGYGSFYAGYSHEEAQRVRASEIDVLEPRTPEGRSDVVKGRIALVTGGAQGFGAEIVRGLVDAGAYVIVADINIDGARDFVNSLNADGLQRASALKVDVSDEESVKILADTIVSETGGLDMLISNAGVLRAGSVLEQSASDFSFVTKINYSAFFLVTKQLAPVMVRQRAACPDWKADILQINSKSGLEGSNRNGAYAGGKFGGIGLVQSFAMELVEYGIKVNAICPGNFFDGPLWSDPDRGLFVQYLNTGKVPGAKTVDDVKAFYEAKVPMGRGCTGDDVMKAILYCVEQEYETGQAVPVTGGQVMLK